MQNTFLFFHAVLKKCIPTEGWIGVSETMACPSVFPSTPLKQFTDVLCNEASGVLRHLGFLLCFQDQFHENGFSRQGKGWCRFVCCELLYDGESKTMWEGAEPNKHDSKNEALSFFSSAFSLPYLRVGLQHCWWDRPAAQSQWQQHLCQLDQKGWGSLPWWPITRRR